jgi:starvation-inducible outer membrane lipoprotein
MKRIIATVLLAAAAVSGCASLPDSIKGPFAHSGRTASDADVSQVEAARPYPQATDEGKF